MGRSRRRGPGPSNVHLRAVGQARRKGRRRAAPNLTLEETALRRAVGAAQSTLAHLIERGTLARDERSVAPRVKTRREKTYTLLRAPTDHERQGIDRAPRRAQALAQLEATG